MRKRNQFESPSHAQMRVATRSKKDDSGRETPRRTMAQPAISNRERLLRLTARYCTSVVSQSFDSSVRPEGSNFHRLALEAFGLLVARDLRRWLTTRQRFPSSVAGCLLLLLCCALATTQPRKVGRHATRPMVSLQCFPFVQPAGCISTRPLFSAFLSHCCHAHRITNKDPATVQAAVPCPATTNSWMSLDFPAPLRPTTP